MTSETSPEKLSVGELARRMRDQMIPLGNRFSYFFTARWAIAFPTFSLLCR